MEQAARGAAALSASKYDEAIEHYTKAIEQNPGAVDYYIKRSTAHQRSSKYTKALADAEKAVVLAHKRARRELIKDSQLRRGIALFFLGQYANAQFVLDIVKAMDEKEKTLAIWESKIAKKMETIPEDDERRKATVLKVPEVEVDTTPVAKKSDESASKAPTSDVKPLTDGISKPSTTPATPTEKPKHDWYQTNESVTFTLLAKNVPKDKTTIEIEKDSLDITYPLANGNDFNYSLLPFFADVDPAHSTYRITPTKIEVVLKKAQPGQRWKTLKGEPKRSGMEETLEVGTAPAKPTKLVEAVPSYPTSSKTGVKNWDKVAAADLGDEDEYEGDETSRFFKHLYKGAGEDAQRAMMKSYQESGGTVLSTDWSNVGSKFIAPEPPEGMEEKKY
ncbi:SGS-domain-containing protein [Bimuria novae-zelandiae CBS 107.79]|uniref:SGS-domain-containing protein n=1 Tax=Bimuria novae-zelandiae CBS 107.79 TaxID=1447943 RepID=A0A6A5UUU3_9PLEO|nr:SGS-domain-containing protein [Bimuria novae-zelandiae CBS 107.79]